MKTAIKIKPLHCARTPRRIRVPAKHVDDKRTEQSHARSCDINTIMARYNKTGVIDHISRHQAKYGDVTSADFLTAQNLVAEQKTIFEELPAFVRDKFENDVGEYLELMQTDEGLEELRSILHPTDIHKENEILAEELSAAANETPPPTPEAEKPKDSSST